MMLERGILILRKLLLKLGRVIGRSFLRITIIGQEHVPPSGSLIVICNHFSWFDAPLLTLFLPFQPTFLVATESQRHFFVRLFIRVFSGIPIWRGRVDRSALQTALGLLNQGGVVGIFPEGGIDPELSGLVSRGEAINNTYDHFSRQNPELVRSRPGTAFLAVESQARLLPVGMIGTDQILNNLLRLRRTPITVNIGPAFGPLYLDPELRGQARRQHLNRLADMIMHRIAALFPPDKRGPYRRKKQLELL